MKNELLEATKIDIAFLKWVNLNFTTNTIGLNISTNSLELFEMLDYCMIQHTIYTNYNASICTKYARLIRVILMRIQRIVGANRFDWHVLREDSIFCIDYSISY